MTLVDFLELLATNEDVEDQFDLAPEAVMSANGVSPADALLILTGSLKEIRKKIRAQKNFAGAQVFLIKMR